MMQAYQTLHSELPATRIWGYEGMYPGPVICARKKEKVLIRWENHLPEKHFLPVDKTLHGTMDGPEVRTVVHLHGAKVRPESDGYPEAWFTNNYEQTGSYFSRRVYWYPNCQQAATLWYHDHALGITRLNVYAGLAGFYLLRDSLERKLNLPKGSYEIPLLIQDRSFNPDGSLFYPSQPEPPVPGVAPSITPGFAGDVILVNGKVWPFLAVEPRKYRFRILNGSNQRFYRVRFDPELPIYQIGTDGGFLSAPVKLEELLLAPAERADVIVDFSDCKGKHLILRNDAPVPFPTGTPADPETTGQIMEFRVVLPLKGKDVSFLPDQLCPVIPIPENLAKVRRDFVMTVRRDQYGRLVFLLNGKSWQEPVTEKPQRGVVEIWNLINPGFVAHPIHIHQIQFQLLNRQPFDVEHFNRTQELVFTSPPVPPSPAEQGWKDTIRNNPGEVTRIIARFGPYTGRYVWHCHLLEHEDYDMMRPLEVVSKGAANR
jgi:spore coat protein A